jgi:hypothetical protein
MNVTLNQLTTAMKTAGHKLFSRGDYNLNFIGVRSDNRKANTFNDVFCVVFKVANQDVLLQFSCTTDPDMYYRQNPLNSKGTARVKTGQYRGLWQLGRHQGKYPALVQVANITVYRETLANTDLDLSDINTETGLFGINCHRASEHGIANTVDKFSAGCQVIQHPEEYRLLINLCHIAAAKHGNSFTYTLLNQSDLEHAK